MCSVQGPRKLYGRDGKLFCPTFKSGTEKHRCSASESRVLNAVCVIAAGRGVRYLPKYDQSSSSGKARGNPSLLIYFAVELQSYLFTYSYLPYLRGRQVFAAQH